MTWPAVALVAQGALDAALALVGAYISFLGMLLLAAMYRARSLRLRRAESGKIRPTLDSAMVAFLAGGTDISVFRQYIKSHPADIAESILRFQTAVAGSARDRLCGLALSLGLVEAWCQQGRSHNVMRRRAAFANLAFACVFEPCRRVAGDLLLDALKDCDEEIRLSACLGLVAAGGEEMVDDLFDLATGPDLLTRIVLTEDLRRHAMALSAGPVRMALRSGDPPRVHAALEILVAWERAIPLEELREFLEHEDRGIRMLAFRLASFVSVNSESRLALVRSLRDADDGIRGLAIVAVGRQKMTEAIPDLAHCLRLEGLELGRRAAAALAAMPPLGWRTLEELSASPSPCTALAASEALDRVRRGI